MKNTKSLRDGPVVAASTGVATASAVTKGCAHSPRPWRWEEAKQGDVYRTALRNVRIYAANSISPGIVFGGLGDETDANARLIAAAPELLAALKAAREFGLDDFKSGEQPIYAQIDAAIAKAEGRA